MGIDKIAVHGTKFIKERVEILIDRISFFPSKGHAACAILNEFRQAFHHAEHFRRRVQTDDVRAENAITHKLPDIGS